MEQQHLPLAVLKQGIFYNCPYAFRIVTTVLTVYGIETRMNPCQDRCRRYKLQQYLPFTVCDEGCEAAEEQSDDGVCTSLVPDRREGKTKVMK